MEREQYGWYLQFDRPASLEGIPAEGRHAALRAFFEDRLRQIRPVLEENSIAIVHPNEFVLSVSLSGTTEACRKLGSFVKREHIGLLVPNDKAVQAATNG